jgi:hypothetical protein
MLSQWDCFLKNLGEWQGSFTRYSINGEELEDTPSICSFTGSNDNKHVRQVLRYLPVDKPAKELVIDYTYLGSSIRFFENGAFSQGSLQWNPDSEFGAEFGLIEGDRRLRMVQLFNSEGKFDRLTLIREQKAGSEAPEQPFLTVDRLLGEWKGEATTIYPDGITEVFPTHLKLERQNSDRLAYTITFGVNESQRSITSFATINGSSITTDADESGLQRQILLLPDGASCNCPLEIQRDRPFFLETGWLCQPNLRYRLIRNYNAKGEWVNSTLVKEELY